MANSGITYRKKGAADIVPPFFTIYVSKPSGTVWWGEEIIDGRAEPLDMVEASCGEFSTLAIDIKLGADPHFPNVEPQVSLELQRWLQAGTRVRLVDASSDPGEEWFVGYVGQDTSLIQGNPQQESYQVSVYGPEWLLSGKVVKGQWVSRAESTTDIFDSADPGIGTRTTFIQTDRLAIFNKDGRPNMSPLPSDFRTSGDDADKLSRAFIQSDFVAIKNACIIRRALTWTAFSALYSALMWCDDGHVVSNKATDWKAIKSVLGDITIGEVSIDGLNLLEALRAILSPIGYGFRLDVKSDGNFKHALSVYQLKGASGGKAPYLPPAGSSVTDRNGSRGEVSRVEFVRDSHNIANEVEVLGSLERVQRALSYRSGDATDLRPVWSNDSDSLDKWFVGGAFKAAQVVNPKNLTDHYHSSGEYFNQHYNAWRTFVFNEDGGGLDYGFFGADGIPDLEKYGLGKTLFKRPIDPLLARDTRTGDYKPALVTMQVTAGGATVKKDVSRHFEILKDRAGIRLKRDVFDILDNGTLVPWRPFLEKAKTGKLTAAEEAASKLIYLDLLYGALNPPDSNSLVITVTGTMESDTAVKGCSTRLKSSPLHLVRQRLVRNPALQEFVISGVALGGEDTRDDTNCAFAQAKTIQYAEDCEIGHGSLMMHTLTRGYPPGTVIPQTAGRVLKFQLDGQRKNAAPVVRLVKHTFGETNVTEIMLDSPLVRLT